MTDRLGASTRWRTAAVVAPAAAAALAMATGWALEHQPAAAGAASTATPAPARPAEPAFQVDRTDVSLHQQALDAQARVVRLTKALHRLQARTESVRSAPLGSGSGAGTVLASGAGGVSVAAPPAPAARPAPATHTSTGASGAP